MSRTTGVLTINQNIKCQHKRNKKCTNASTAEVKSNQCFNETVDTSCMDYEETHHFNSIPTLIQPQQSTDIPHRHFRNSRSGRKQMQNKKSLLNSKKPTSSSSAYNHTTKTQSSKLFGTVSVPTISQLRTMNPLQHIEGSSAKAHNFASGEHVGAPKKTSLQHKNVEHNSVSNDMSNLPMAFPSSVNYSTNDEEDDLTQENLTIEHNRNEMFQEKPSDFGHLPRSKTSKESFTSLIFHLIHLIAFYSANTVWETGKLFGEVITRPFMVIKWVFVQFAFWCKLFLKGVGFLLAVIAVYLFFKKFVSFSKNSEGLKNLIFGQQELQSIGSNPLNLDGDAVMHSLQKLELTLQQVELQVADRHASVLETIKKMQSQYENDQSRAVENQSNMLSSVKAILSRSISSELLKNNELFQNKIEDIQLELSKLHANHSNMVNLLQNEIYEKVELSKVVHQPLIEKLQEFEQKLLNIDKVLQNLKKDHNEFKTEFNHNSGNVSFLREISTEQFIENFLLLLQHGANSKSDKEKAAESRRHRLLAVIFFEWLQKRGFVNENTFQKLQEQVIKQTSKLENNLKKSLDASISEMKRSSYTQGLSLDSSNHNSYSSVVTKQLIKAWINDALKVYSADRVGIPDYALESAGASVVESRCSLPLNHNTAVVSIFGIPLYYNINGPRTLIHPSVMPGECWAFKGSEGVAVIALSATIRVASVTLEHIPKSIALYDNISSAPKDFSVYGLKSASERQGQLLGRFRFEEDGESIQQFPVENVGESFDHIELRIESNWGHPDFTCVYRFRVHGQRMES